MYILTQLLWTKNFSLVMVEGDLESSKVLKQMLDLISTHVVWRTKLAQQGCGRCFSLDGGDHGTQGRCQECKILAEHQCCPGQKNDFNWPVVRSALGSCFSPWHLRRQKIRNHSIFFFNCSSLFFRGASHGLSGGNL